MTPRKTKQGASAKSRTANGAKTGRASASPRSNRTSTPRGTSGTNKATSAKGRTTPSSAARRPATGPARRTNAGAAPRRNDRPWWLLPTVLISTVVVFVWVYYPVAAVQYRESKERARLQVELDALKARNLRLSSQVERLKTPAGVEDYARSQLGLVKKGENVVVVVDRAEGTKTAPPAASPIDSDETATKPEGTMTALLDLIFGLR